MARYINPLTDEGFKRIFGQEEHKSLLIAFLNRLFEGELHIKDVQYLDKELLPMEHDHGKRILCDIYCTIDNGEHVIVEMQNAMQLFFQQRSILYAARTLDLQAQKGRNWGYDDLKAVYSISFLNYAQPGFPENLLVDGQIRDTATNELVNPYLHLIYIQLPLMTKTLEECESDFERWIYLLKNVETMDAIPAMLTQELEELKYFEEVMEKSSLSREERARYEYSLKNYRDQESIIRSAQIVGEERGRAEGRAKGRAEGLEEGRLEAFKNMAAFGMPLEDIAKIYHTTVEKVTRMINGI